MRRRRLFATVVLVLMMVLAQVFTAMAAETEVKKIRINVTNYNGQLKFSSGEEEKYTVTWPSRSAT